MDKKKKELLEEAIQIELNMCNLYLFYSENFTDDKDFWIQIAQEEREHAALLELGEDFFDKFPEEIVYNHLDELKFENKRIKRTIEQYEKDLPEKKRGLQICVCIGE